MSTMRSGRFCQAVQCLGDRHVPNQPKRRLRHGIRANYGTRFRTTVAECLALPSLLVRSRRLGMGEHIRWRRDLSLRQALGFKPEHEELRREYVL